MARLCAVASPLNTKSSSSEIVKPRDSMIAPVAPFGAAASKRSARSWVSIPKVATPEVPAAEVPIPKV
jgi:hypothetical protein